MIFETLGQFQKLCQSYSRCIDLSKEQMLEIVESHLEGCRHRSQGKIPHWAYEGIVHHMALAGLRDALKHEIAGERRAA